ncbi:hypothetical protein Barb6XT_01442 [Bacteroidales bacterium Barb6XT]|nr:hypothetical protein Barb6XT_01442 [Bacteroidales bacterium Barb6XT]
MFPQQGEEQALTSSNPYNNGKHASDPDYPRDKDFKDGELRDVLVIIYGASYNSHFVMRNVTKIQQRCFGLWMYFTIDDYDSRSYDKQNLDAIGWHFSQTGHRLNMDWVPQKWGFRVGDVGDFDNYPHMKKPIAPFGTLVRDCDIPPVFETQPVGGGMPLPSRYEEIEESGGLSSVFSGLFLSSFFLNEAA